MNSEYKNFYVDLHFQIMLLYKYLNIDNMFIAIAQKGIYDVYLKYVYMYAYVNMWEHEVLIYEKSYDNEFINLTFSLEQCHYCI